MSKNFDARKLIQFQLAIILFVNCLQMVNSLRWNEKLPYINGKTILGKNSLSDVVINSLCFVLGSQAVQSLSALPMQVVLTPCIPDNVEAAMTALITGIFVFSSDVGCKMSGSLFCSLFNVSNEQLDRYWVILAAKIPCVLVVMALTQLIPTNREVQDLADRLDRRADIVVEVDEETEALMPSEKRNSRVVQRHSMPLASTDSDDLEPIA